MDDSTSLDFQAEFTRLLDRGDLVAALRLAFSVFEQHPSRSAQLWAKEAFNSVARDAIKHAYTYIDDPTALARLSMLLSEVQISGIAEPCILDVLTTELLIVQAFRCLGPESIEQAHHYLLRAAQPEPPIDLRSSEKLLGELRHLHALMLRGFDVFDAVLRRYAALARNESYSEAVAHLAAAKSMSRSATPSGTPGQVSILLSLPHPVLREEFGQVIQLTALVTTDTSSSIELAPSLAGRATSLPLALRQELISTSKQALALVQRTLGDSRFKVHWDLDNPNEYIAGPSLGLGLALAILSARAGIPLPSEIGVTGTINVLGDVGPVGSLEAKARAAAAAGLRSLLIPSADAGQHGIPNSVDRAEVWGISVSRVRSFADAADTALPHWKSHCRALHSSPVRSRNVRRLWPILIPAAATIALAVNWQREANRNHTQAPGISTISGKPSLRYRYFVADGDLVLNAIAQRQYRMVFPIDADPIVINNPVFQTMLSVDKTYFRPADELTYEKLVGYKRPDDVKTAYPEFTHFRKLPVGRELLGQKTKREYRLPSHTDKEFLRDSEPEDPREPATLLVHRRAFASAVLNPMLTNLDPLSRDLIRANPSLWDIIDLSSFLGRAPDCGSGSAEVPLDRIESLKLRPLKLLFLAVDNIGHGPALKLSYSAREFVPDRPKSLRLRTSSESEALLGTCALNQKPLPSEAIRPGETLLIPLMIGLGGVDEDTVPTLHDPQSVVTSPKIFYFGDPVKDSNQPYKRHYYFGPMARVAQLSYEDVSGLSHVEGVRAVSPERVQFASAGVIGASCPYLFCFDDAHEGWVNTGTVLTGRSSKRRFGTDYRHLNGKPTRFELRELEPETSYVDSAVLEIWRDGRRITTILPSDAVLKRPDGMNKVLRLGQSMSVVFPDSQSIQGERVLAVSGYFVPDAKRTIASLKRKTDRKQSARPRL